MSPRNPPLTHFPGEKLPLELREAVSLWQLEGAFPDTMTKCAELLNRTIDVDFVDINVGCPIDLVYKKVRSSVFGFLPCILVFSLTPCCLIAPSSLIQSSQFICGQ